MHQNLLEQGGLVSVHLELRDLDEDGDLDLLLQVTWLTVYFQNTGNATHPEFTYRQDRPVVVTLNHNVFGPPSLVDIDEDGQHHHPTTTPPPPGQTAAAPHVRGACLPLKLPVSLPVHACLQVTWTSCCTLVMPTRWRSLSCEYHQKRIAPHSTVCLAGLLLLGLRHHDHRWCILYMR